MTKSDRWLVHGPCAVSYRIHENRNDNNEYDKLDIYSSRTIANNSYKFHKSVSLSYLHILRRYSRLLLKVQSIERNRYFALLSLVMANDDFYENVIDHTTRPDILLPPFFKRQRIHNKSMTQINNRHI